MAPKPTRACFHCCSSALATVPQFRSCNSPTVVAVEILLPEHCCSYGSKPRWFWASFWLFLTVKSQAGPKKIFLKKKGHMGAQPWTPICPFFYTKNLFSAQLDFPPSRTAKKAPNPTWACFHCCSSALATVFQLPQPWTPIWPFFY